MKRYSQRLKLEILEDRRLLATCHVSRLGDFGAGGDLGGGHSRGDLRYCINKANDLPGHDTIDISATGTVNLTGPLPDLSTDMDIVGAGSSALTVRRNTGGNYRIFTIADGAVVQISGLSVKNGNHNLQGGAISNWGTLTLTDTDIVGNVAAYGGGIHNGGSGILLISNSTVSSNLGSGGTGGGIYNNGSLIITNSTISNNQAKNSGPDFPAASGGGIYNGGSATIQYSTIANNKTDCTGPDYPASFGGGIQAYGPLTIANSTISGNLAIVAGGESLAVGGGLSLITATISNSTIANNKTAGGEFEGGSGGVYIAVSATITHSTVAGNSEGIEIDGALTLRNSIVANNTHGDLRGAITNSGYNLIGNSTGGSGYVPSDLLNVDPKLDGFANNGGPTPTMALLPGSPAIDSGLNQGAPEWDQRGPGFPRIANGTIDRGAFEVQSTGAPAPFRDLALFITADLEAIDGMRG